jgi:hypothetical protein
MNGYELSRKWFDFCFENPEKIKPNHSALYFFAIEHCNRLGWKEKFGFPTEMAKDAIGIKNYRTYINTLNDLVEWGFIKMIEKSKNQYSANIIALVNYTKATTKATTKALDKAMSKHSQKQSKSNYKSIDSINKQRTNNKEQINNIPEFSEFKNHALSKKPNIDLQALKNKYESWVENGWKDGNNNKIINWKSKLTNTVTYIPEKRQIKNNFSQGFI